MPSAFRRPIHITCDDASDYSKPAILRDCPCRRTNQSAVIYLFNNDLHQQQSTTHYSSVLKGNCLSANGLRWSAELSTILKPTRNHFRIIESIVLLLFINIFHSLKYNVYYKKQFRATVFVLWFPKWRPGGFFCREWGWRFLKSATPSRFYTNRKLNLKKQLFLFYECVWYSYKKIAFRVNYIIWWPVKCKK